LKVFHINVRIK